MSMAGVSVMQRGWGRGRSLPGGPRGGKHISAFLRGSGLSSSLVMNVRVLLAALGGLLFGAIGSALFIDSTPPEKGTPEAKADKLQSELTRAQSRIALLETQVPKKVLSIEDQARASMGRILEDLRA